MASESPQTQDNGAFDTHRKKVNLALVVSTTAVLVSSVSAVSAILSWRASDNSYHLEVQNQKYARDSDERAQASKVSIYWFTANIGTPQETVNLVVENHSLYPIHDIDVTYGNSQGTVSQYLALGALRPCSGYTAPQIVTDDSGRSWQLPRNVGLEFLYFKDEKDVQWRVDGQTFELAKVNTPNFDSSVENLALPWRGRINFQTLQTGSCG